MKGMADSLGDLGWPMNDRILVPNILRRLSDRYAHLWTWITRQQPFPVMTLSWRSSLRASNQGPPPRRGLSPRWGPRLPRLSLPLLCCVHPLRRRLFLVLLP